MNNSSDSVQDGERRDFFRIDDNAHLSYRVLEEENYRNRIAEADPFVGEAPCGVVAELRALTTQAGSVMTSIRKDDPNIAQYLGILERKIELIARLVESERHRDDKPNSRVNIGAGGLSFSSAEPVEADSKVEVKLVLFPSYLCIRALGQVVRTREKSTDAALPYRVGIEFTYLPEAEREALVKHTLERQSAMLRQRSGR